MSQAYRAMLCAHEVHKNQKRKYTGDPYVIHLGEVAGLVASVAMFETAVSPEVMIATSWLHDSREDQDVSDGFIRESFGSEVAMGVGFMSNLTTGSRKERKALFRAQLYVAPCWVQTIECADIISNARSIVLHDPKFASIYLEEKLLMLHCIEGADARLWSLAMSIVTEEIHEVKIRSTPELIVRTSP